MDAVGLLAKPPCVVPSKASLSQRRSVAAAASRLHGCAARSLSFHSHHHLELAAFQPSPFLSLSFRSGRRAAPRARKVKPGVFLPHLVAAMEGVEETYVMIKPDGVQRGLIGEIISRFEKKGFLLKGLKLFQCPKELAEEHYKDLKDKSFYPKLIDYITSGPVVCMAWEGDGVVASARKLIGATNPLQAEPGTIRGDLAVQTGRNVVHGSDSPDNGHREVALWFKEGELCHWLPAQALWLKE
ncbi:nucleoside diphosphate kinase 2, chloroplastic [Canna indica]|uniref:Nucleoside diphosphate kinase n=1 Tax=Canna indica TaxID=4628 RepID=A0AAQ3KPM8_9LILI|nr:nucleoside diphosphate kinase 2, chloroplastic [Canna indica]